MTVSTDHWVIWIKNSICSGVDASSTRSICSEQKVMLRFVWIKRTFYSKHFAPTVVAFASRSILDVTFPNKGFWGLLDFIAVYLLHQTGCLANSIVIVLVGWVARELRINPFASNNCSVVRDPIQISIFNELRANSFKRGADRGARREGGEIVRGLLFEMGVGVERGKRRWWTQLI